MSSPDRIDTEPPSQTTMNLGLLLFELSEELYKTREQLELATIQIADLRSVIEGNIE